MGLVPAHTDDGVAVSLAEPRIIPTPTYVHPPSLPVKEVAALTEGRMTLAHECGVFGSRDIANTHRERSCDRNLVLGSFIGITEFFRDWRAHREAPGRDNDHFRTLWTIPKSRAWRPRQRMHGYTRFTEGD
jgi:hypothetical protein